jgi:PQQ-dependent dehydrogenase (methanol/ethanol family)
MISRTTRTTTVAAVAASVSIGAMLASGSVMAAADLQKAASNNANNAMTGINQQMTRYSELNQINADNVKRLVPAWSFSTGVLRGHEGEPLVIDGTMYIHTPFPNNVFAIDLDTQQIKWSYEPTQDSSVIGVMCCDTVYRGLAFGDGKIFLQQADTTLVALDAKTGERQWSVKNGDPAKGATNTNAPMVVGDKVVTGISGGEFGVRGFAIAYNIKDGSVAWKAYSTGPDDEMLVSPTKTTHMGKPIGRNTGIDSWDGDEWTRGGGTTWGWFTYDPDLNLLYYGTGNPGTWNPEQRPGDNKWSMTIFARDMDTGEARWVYQKTPWDQWDYDGVNENILVDQEFNGEMRKLLVNFDRNGFGYTLDRATGELLVAEKYDPTVNWATHIDMETGRPQVDDRFAPGAQGADVNTTGICPAALGYKDQQPASYSPRTGLFYVPTNHICMDYEPYAVTHVAGQPYVGATLSMYATPDSFGGTGKYIAWDAVKGEVVWEQEEAFAVWSGSLTTAGDVTFHGTLEGNIKARDVHTGEELWSFRTPSGIIGNVFTYEHNGKQFVGVYSGIGGWAGIGMAAGLTGDSEGLGAVGAFRGLYDHTRLGGSLTVFALPDFD